MRRPRLAELVAGELRGRIVGGLIADGGDLPSVDRLVSEFGVGAPAVREALRILENEGLITVRRGNVGGAVVHAPRAESAAYTLGLVLQYKGVPVATLNEAVVHLESMCASLCASREDRAETVVPRLEAAHAEAVRTAAVGGREFVDAARAFHQELVRSCGNEALVLVVGALAGLWSAQEESWSRRIRETGQAPGDDVRTGGLEAHEEILAAIAGGDAAAAATAVQRHLHQPDVYAMPEDDTRIIEATTFRERHFWSPLLDRFTDTEAGPPDA